MKMILWEVWAFGQIPLYLYLFKKFGNRNVAGDILAGTMIGCFIEFATEPLWDYHFKVVIYKDIPIAVLLGWGALFTLVTAFSEKLYKVILKKDSILHYDKRIFIFDVIAAAIVAFPLETMGLKAGIWDYNYDMLQWNWGTVPFFEMPYEALFGYCLLMLIAPTFVRYWQGAFEGHR